MGSGLELSFFTDGAWGQVLHGHMRPLSVACWRGHGAAPRQAPAAWQQSMAHAGSAAALLGQAHHALVSTWATALFVRRLLQLGGISDIMHPNEFRNHWRDDRS
jgi:hypothetical protein